MRRTLSVIIIFAFMTNSFAQTRADVDNAVSRFQYFYNNHLSDSIFNMLSNRTKVLMSLEKTRETFSTLSTQLGNFKTYEYTKESRGFSFYKTVFANATVSLVVSLNKENLIEQFRFIPYQEEDTTPVVHDISNIVLKTATGNLYGTLTMPEGKARVPVVLIIAGSGPTDRNCNAPEGNLKSNAYKMIADSLLSAGIACVRYDKRGAGESKGSAIKEDSMSFEIDVNDAAGFAKMLKADERFSKVIIMGHSEGSLIGMIVARREKAAAYISLEGAGEKIDKILVKQLRAQSGELAAQASIILDSLNKGYLVKDIDTPLLTIFRPSVQPYMISWLKYDPAQEIKKLSIPVLIIQGTTDIQVSTEDAESLKKAYPKAALRLVHGMNHVLKQASDVYSENVATYSKPTLPLSQGLMPAIIGFCLGSVSQYK